MCQRLSIGLILLFLSQASAAASLQITTDNQSLFFGSVEPGEEKVLARFGSYHNEISITSANEQTWFLKLHLLEPFSSASDEIPSENFEWQVVFTDGNGILSQEREYSGFDLVPSLVYTSGSDEASGSAVKFQFKYRLMLPEALISGSYHARIRITVMEML